MKKEKKERVSLFKKIREYWKIPRYRALITLGIYILFFVIIYLYIQIMNHLSGPSIEKVQVDPLIEYSSMDNYEYSYEIDVTGSLETSSYVISGIRYDNQDNFKISNNSFYVQDNIIYSLDGVKNITDFVQIDLLLLLPNRIYDSLNYSTNTSKIEYQNGDAKVTYSIPVSKFNVAFLQGIDETNTDVVEVTMYEYDNQIYQIDLNLYNLMKLVDPTLQGYSIKMTYTNINNIKNVEELK